MIEARAAVRNVSLPTPPPHPRRPDLLPHVLSLPVTVGFG